MSAKIVTFGEIMLRLSSPDLSKTVQTDEHVAVFGGGEANVAISLAQLGTESRFVTRLADDEISTAAVNMLQRYGVDTSHVVRGGKRLGLYFLEPGYSIRPSKVIYDREFSAITEMSPAMVDWEELFEGVDWFHWSGITPAIGTKPRQCVEMACRTAKQQGVTVSCDLNFRDKLWSEEQARKAMVPLMNHVDVCIGNPWAVWKCLGFDPELPENERYVENFSFLVRNEFDFDSVVMTLREDISASMNGWSTVMCDSSDCSTPYRSTRYEIEVVDRVGGGDSFAASLIYGLLNFSNSTKALEFATAASVLKLTISGDFNLAQESEIIELMENAS